MSLFDDASLVLTPNGYKASKLYSIKPTSGLGDMVVSRGTTATRVNSAGLIESVAINVPRLDYTGGGCPKILVEPARTNNVLYSEQFDNAYWVKTLGGVASAPVVTANVETAPDGTTTADRVVFNLNGGTASGDLSSLGSGIFTSISITRTQSVWIKTTDGTTKVFSFISPTGALTPITVTSVYQRFTWTSTGINVSSVRLRLRGSAAGEGTATSATIAIWGAQYEDGSNATSYIPTVAATVTRNADVISQTGISSLIGQTEGTIYAEINNTLMTSYSTGYVMRIFADANNEVWIRKESGTNKYTAKWRANSVDVYTQSTISVLNGNNKIAIAYKSTDSAVYLNGSQIGTSASTGAFSVAPSQIGIGSSSTADFFNDRIELATLFPTRLTNAQLATLTTL